MIAKHGSRVVMIGSRKEHNICELVGMKASKKNETQYIYSMLEKQKE